MTGAVSLERRYREAVFSLYHDEGVIEIDLDSDFLPSGLVSESTEGAYVLAWVWVAKDQIPGYPDPSRQPPE